MLDMGLIGWLVVGLAVDGVVVQRRLVGERRVPEVEVERPQRARHHRVGEHPQAVEQLDAQDRRDQRTGAIVSRGPCRASRITTRPGRAATIDT